MEDTGSQAESAADYAARVSRAAAELGIPVPDGFQLLGAGKGGRPVALTSGTARDFRFASAILARLGGKPVDECLASMHALAEGPMPEWARPVDWNDRQAVEQYLDEREKHPEWPNVYNGGGGDLIAHLGTAGGIAALAAATASVLNLHGRRAFAKFVVQKAVEQGVQIDPAEVIRAFEGAPVRSPEAPDEPAVKNTAEQDDGESAD
ncbi:hypothetical protein [Micromonospora sp. NPDC126480]|uniref:hypothetical protein n=1 Tax=Micromonospora sp. NPDC126480 TaxID=3155312 RepID=UPI00331754CC